MEEPKKSYWTNQMDFSGMKKTMTGMKATLDNMQEIYKIKRRELEVAKRKLNGNATSSLD